MIQRWNELNLKSVHISHFRVMKKLTPDTGHIPANFVQKFSGHEHPRLQWRTHPDEREQFRKMKNLSKKQLPTS